MRALRKHALNYLVQLWMLTSDRWHEKDTTVLMTELKADWCRVQKLLGRSRDKASNRMPAREHMTCAHSDFSVARVRHRPWCWPRAR